MNPRSPWTALLLAVVIGAAVFLIDRVAPEPAAGPQPAVAPVSVEPVAGSWVCAVGDGRDETSLATVVARPDALGLGPASLDLVTLREGDAASSSLSPLFPPSHTRETVDLEADDVAVWARWSGAPATVSREWSWSGDGDLPPATVAGPCAQPFSSEWIIPGMSTVGGNEARIRLANPFRTDATIAIHFVTPEGIRAPIALQNWTVPARTVREININEVIPEVDDLAAVIDVATGRLSVEGYQIARSAIGGVDGGSLLAAAPAPAENWTVPWVADGDDVVSWLWIVNTGERTAPIELTLHTPQGGDVPDGLAELSVPPGELRRVDLSGTLPAGIEDAAVTVRSDGAPVVVSAATRRTSPVVEDPEADLLDPDEVDPDEVDPDEVDPDQVDPEDTEDPDQTEEPDPAEELEPPPLEDVGHGGAPDTGMTVQLGVPALDRWWTLSGGSTAEREEQLRLVNPGGASARVEVVLFDGTRVLEPEELAAIDVAAGSAVSVDLTEHLGQVSEWTAFITATDGGVIAGRVGSGGGDALRLVATPGASLSASAPDDDLLAGVEASGFVHRMGTSLGLQATDPFEAPTPTPEGPTPPPTDFDDLLDLEGFEEDEPVQEPDPESDDGADPEEEPQPDALDPVDDDDGSAVGDT